MPRQVQRARATLTAVADRAGVSVSTVSLVLSGKADERRIPADTCQRVNKAAEDLNYAPNLLTRSLRRGRTHVLSFFSSFRHRDWGDLYMDRVSSAIELAGGQFGYDVLIHCNYRRSVRETAQFLNGGMADGLLMFAPAPGDPLLEMLRQTPLPIVIVNGHDPLDQYSSAADDVVQGIGLVVDAFISRGHTEIAAMGSQGQDVRDSDERLRLLREALEARGLSLPEERVVCCSKDPGSGLRQLMELKNPPTALFCWHDLLAYRTLEACERLGIRVPDDLSIVGYDGLHWPSVSPHICCSVDVDLSAVACAAVRLLDLSIADPSAPRVHEAVPVGFRSGTTLAPRVPLQRSNHE